MEDVRDLKELQLDALREVANIGAGHAATALSQMTNRTIMISVPEVNVRALEDVAELVGTAGRGRRGGADAHDGRPHRAHAAAVPRALGARRCATSCCGAARHHRASSARWSSPRIKEAGNILAART